jgi:lupeol synthase
MILKIELTYSNIQFQEDLYCPRPLVQYMVWGLLYHVGEPLLNYWPFSKLRQSSLEIAINHIRYEDENGRYIGVGSAVKVI